MNIYAPTHTKACAKPKILEFYTLFKKQTKSPKTYETPASGINETSTSNDTLRVNGEAAKKSSCINKKFKTPLKLPSMKSIVLNFFWKSKKFHRKKTWDRWKDSNFERNSLKPSFFWKQNIRWKQLIISQLIRNHRRYTYEKRILEHTGLLFPQYWSQDDTTWQVSASVTIKKSVFPPFITRTLQSQRSDPIKTIR